MRIMEQLDARIGPLLAQDGEHFNKRWGYLSRAEYNDKSQLAMQIEKYADLYTSRVSNFLPYTPFVYFRSASQKIAHDRNLTGIYDVIHLVEEVGEEKEGGREPRARGVKR